HVANDPVSSKAADNGDIVGHALCKQIGEPRELIFGCFVERAPQERFTGLQHPIEWTVLPAVGGLNILRIETGRGESIWTGAAVFEQSGFGRTIAPAKQTAFVNRMKRVD